MATQDNTGVTTHADGGSRKPGPGQNLAEEWSIYWRGTIIASLLLGSLILLNDPGRNPVTAFVGLILVFLLMYPFALLAKVLLFRSPGFFILALILFSGTPLLALVWGWICMFVFRSLLVVHKAWAAELVIGGLIFTASAIASRQMPAESAAPVSAVEEAVRPKVASTPQPSVPIPAPAKEPPPPPPPPAPRAPILNEFRDFSGYYTVQIPEGYTLNDKTSGARSKYEFKYGPDLSAWIIVSEMHKPWDPASEMEQKAEAIGKGQGPFPGPMTIDQSRLVEFGDAAGYELVISGFPRGRPVRAHSFALVGQGMAVSIAITCSAEEDVALFEALARAIQNTFQLTDRSSQIVGRGAGSAIIQPNERVLRRPPPHFPQPDTWSAAREAIRIMGVMKQGDRQVALINGNMYGVGDTVPVSIFGNIHTFAVQSIGANSDEVILEPAP